MKNLYIILFLLGASQVTAQHALLPDPYTFVPSTQRTEVVTRRGIQNSTQLANLDTDRKLVSVSYMDGLGRRISYVAQNANPYRQDVISIVDYDTVGRPEGTLLPYVHPHDRVYSRYDSMLAHLLRFYDNPNDKVADDDYPFAKNVYDPSPLDFLAEQGAPGADWQPGQHTIKRTFTFNVANEIRRWQTNLTSSGYYAADELVIRTMKDEHDSPVKIISDKAGRVLEKHVLAEPGVYLKTLYIYNERGQLYFILQPEGVRLLGSGTTIGSTLSDPFGFFFTYDADGRLIEKKEPGAAAQYNIYDPLGRLVLTQDGHLREQNKWMYIKYDRFNRVIMQGLYTNTSQTTRATVQALADALTYSTGETYYEKKLNGGTLAYTNQSFPTTNIESLSAVYYDDYDLDASGTDDYSYTAQSLSLIIPTDTLAEGTQFKTRGRVTATKTKITGTNNWLVTYAFYDQWGRVIQVRSNNHLSLTPDNLTTNLYDFVGQLWLTKKYHNAGGSHTTTVINRYTYDHAGRVKKVFQKNNSDAEVQAVTYQYNELGQVIAKNLHCLDCNTEDIVEGGAVYAENVIKTSYVPAEDEYVARSNVFLKPSSFLVASGNTLHARIDVGESEAYLSKKFVQSVDYRYTIRGWLKSINNSQLTNDDVLNDDTNDLFGMELLYNTEEAGLNNIERYNGNISGMVWKGPGSDAGSLGRQSYKFGYDKSGRLLSATYGVKTASNWTGEAGGQNEAISYDYNGNIKTLQRTQRKYSWTGDLPEYISETTDNLTYTYANNTNQLTKVEDAATGDAALLGFVNGANVTTEYTYNSNGSITADKNKGIDSVKYNFMGKPVRVKFSSGKAITYVYDAAGVKLTQKLFQGSTLLKATQYVNGFEYENDTLRFFSSPDGRVVNKNGTLEYEYSITDHQGNNRIVFGSVAPEADVVIADFETADGPDFTNDNNRSGMSEMNHTAAGSYSQLLHGGYAAQIGASRIIHVYPGDTVTAEVYAKYRNVTATTSNLTGFAGALTGAFNVSSMSVGEALNAYNSLNDFGGMVASVGRFDDDDGAPKGFVTIMLFDKHHNLLDAAWDQIEDGYEQTSTPPTKDPFDHLIQQMVVREEGYAYVFVSNENPTKVDIHFDDLKVTHSKTRVIQYNEYYPFGLQTERSWTRETNSNKYLYNAASELEVNSGWYETHFRGYDPALGRFLQVDPLATKYSGLTPYIYAFNSPLMFNDPSGAEPPDYAHQWWIYDTYGFDAYTNYLMYGNIHGISTNPRHQMMDGRDAGGGGGGGESMTLSEFLDRALNGSQFGGSWKDGYGYFFTSSLQGLFAGIAYNNRHNSWANTAYGSALGSFIAFGIISISGQLPEYSEVQSIINPSLNQMYASASSRNNGDPWYVTAWNEFLNQLRNAPTLGPGPNPFYQAEAIYWDAGLSGIGHEIDLGNFVVLIGKDAGKVFSFDENTIWGFGTSVGVAGELGRVDMIGNPLNFTADMFYGNRTKYSGSVDIGYGFSIGGAFAISYAGDIRIITSSISLGWGLGTFVSFGLNGGIIKKE